MEIRYHLDESVDPAVARGLRRRNIDASTSADAGLDGAPDAAQLNHANKTGRVLVTHDADFLVLHSRGAAHAGLAYSHVRSVTIGKLVLALADLWRRETAEALRGELRFFPFD